MSLIQSDCIHIRSSWPHLIASQRSLF